ncbi:MAG: hypothetical protein AAB638_01425 [Patescibacteria group bacterium]
MKITDVSKLRGPLGELNDQLLGENGEERLVELNLWLKGVVTKLLIYVSEFPLGSVDKFEASKKFTKDNTKVKFYDFGSNFQTNFGNKIETNVGAETIVFHHLEQSAHDLEQSAHDLEIMTALGSDKRVISLTHFYGALEVQGQGQAGPLRVDGYANIAYIEDVNGIVGAVRACWHAGFGWRVDAGAVDRPIGWRGGRQVLSCKSA